MPALKRGNRRGFTLIELLVAITILSIIVAMIYASFSSVVYSVEDARAESEQLRTQQFLARSLTQNLGQALEGWSPGAAFRTFNPATAGGAQQGQIDRGIMRYQFVGTDDVGSNGPMDSLSFASSAPLLGAQALPGQVKLVTYELQEDEDTDPLATGEPRQLFLTVTETPLINTGAGPEQGFGTANQMAEQVHQAAETMGAPSVSWSVPVYAWDLTYYDGQRWVDTWDSLQLGRLPWMVRARIKLDSPENDEFAERRELDPEKDPTVIELMIPVPIGAGIHDEPPDYARPANRGGT